MRAASYAKRFAAKEACAKALGTGLHAGRLLARHGRRQPALRQADHGADRRRGGAARSRSSRPACRRSSTSRSPTNGRWRRPSSSSRRCRRQPRRNDAPMICAAAAGNCGGAAGRLNPYHQTNQDGAMSVAEQKRRREGEAGRHLGDDQGRHRGAADRARLPHLPLPSLQHPVRLDGADAADRRLSVRLEVQLRLQPLLLPDRPLASSRAASGRAARARRHRGLPAAARAGHRLHQARHRPARRPHPGASTACSTSTARPVQREPAGDWEGEGRFGDRTPIRSTARRCRTASATSRST